MLMVINLITKGSVSGNELVQQLKNTNEIKIYIKENLNKLSMPELTKIISAKSIIDSDKPFESIIKILRESLSNYDITTTKTITQKPNNEKSNMTKLDGGCVI